MNFEFQQLSYRAGRMHILVFEDPGVILFHFSSSCLMYGILGTSNVLNQMCRGRSIWLLHKLG